MPNVSLIDGHIDGKQTNYDRIRSMSVEEMAWFIAEQITKLKCNSLREENSNLIAMQIEYFKKIVFREYLKYLESEVEGE